MRLALGLEYNGTPFTGWQSQPEGTSGQDALERALAAIAGVPLRSIAAGRTDAGVHACMQVVHFDCEVERPLTAWVRGVNAHLPEAMAVLWAAPVPNEFHARYSAMARHYTYYLADRPVRCALFADRIGWHHRALDVDVMREASACLVGTHDFSAFRAAECQAKTPVKTMSTIDIRREGELVRMSFSANAFLHHMIRNIVGSLVHVGAGKAPVSWMHELLESRDRTRAAATFAAQGLYFTGADYPTGFELPATRRALAFDPG
ncbi:MAG TPA: tRNA pseudouridine(38-40) synthase TruA [Casimicrobiaceae bacterium]|nr:tRNA pseudouridine(38-40) synthase TruA [Casimicrobiaceae bacterium]